MATLPSWLEPFSPDVQRAVSAQLAEGRTGLLACFDADGTLWSEDVGEALFRWLAEGQLLPKHATRERHALWEEYEARVAKNRSEGYGWAVACMAGLAEEDVRRWCRQLAAAWPCYRPEMAALVRGLSGVGYEVWLVSASNRWIVEAAAPSIGADPSRVLGVKVAVDGAVLTDRVLSPVTCNAGKVDAIRERIGRMPDLAVGDSLGDVEMLESARLPLVVGRRDKPGAELPKIAAGRGWATHLF